MKEGNNPNKVQSAYKMPMMPFYKCTSELVIGNHSEVVWSADATDLNLVFNRSFDIRKKFQMGLESIWKMSESTNLCKEPKKLFKNQAQDTFKIRENWGLSKCFGQLIKFVDSKFFHVDSDLIRNLRFDWILTWIFSRIIIPYISPILIFVSF